MSADPITMHTARPIQPRGTPRSPSWRAGLSSRAAFVVTAFPPRPISAPCGWIVDTAGLPLRALPGRWTAPEARIDPALLAADRCEHVATALRSSIAFPAMRRPLRSTRRELIRGAAETVASPEAGSTSVSSSVEVTIGLSPKWDSTLRTERVSRRTNWCAGPYSASKTAAQPTNHRVRRGSWTSIDIATKGEVVELIAADGRLQSRSTQRFTLTERRQPHLFGTKRSIS